MAKPASAANNAAAMNGGVSETPVSTLPVQTQQRNHTLWVVFCISALGLASILCGTYLIMHNHESGGTLLISTGGTGTITGLIGLLSMSKATPPQAPLAIAPATSDGTDAKKK